MAARNEVHRRCREGQAVTLVRLVRLAMAKRWGEEVRLQRGLGRARKMRQMDWIVAGNLLTK